MDLPPAGPRKPVKRHNSPFFWVTRDVAPGFVDLPPAGPRKPVKRHNGRFYWLTRDVALGLARLCPPGRILGTQTFRAAGVVRILPTHTFSVCRHRRRLATHTFSGCRHRRSCILGTHSGRGFAFYLHTLFGRPGCCILPTHTFGAILKRKFKLINMT